MMAGLRIVVSEHAPCPTLLRYPKKGPYYQRRLKRLQRDPKNWSKPEYFMMGDMVIAHPSVVHLLYGALHSVAGAVR